MAANAYWFLGLALISASVLIWVCFRTRSAQPLYLYLFMVGVGYLIEFVIYILLGSYEYKPKILHNDSYFDSNMGAIASNFFSLPVSAMLIAVFRLGWKSMAGFIVLFACIEWLFLSLGIYVHHWWKTGFTAAGLPFYFGTAKLVFRWMSSPVQGWREAVILFCISGAVLGTLQIMPVMFFDSRQYHFGWFDRPGRDTTAAAAVFYLFISLLFTLSVMLRWRAALLKYVLAMSVIITVTAVMQGTGLLEVKLWWDLWYYRLLNLSVLIWLSFVARKLEHGLIDDLKPRG